MSRAFTLDLIGGSIVALDVTQLVHPDRIGNL
jgi:hypothetical protein